MAMLVGWDGSQRRQYALLQPSDVADGSQFLVSWDAIKGRHGNHQRAEMDDLEAKQIHIKTLAIEENLRSPSSVHAAMTRLRKRQEVQAACVRTSNQEEDASDQDEGKSEAPAEEERGSNSEESDDDSGESEASDEDGEESEPAPVRKLFSSRRRSARQRSKAAAPAPKQNPKERKVPNDMKGWGFARLSNAPTPEVRSPLYSLLFALLFGSPFLA